MRHRHTEPDYYGEPSKGCLIGLSLAFSLALFCAGCYWLAQAISSHLSHFTKP